jgi:ubiquinone/menaquinone biosynthesis C-methylase UbiE
MLGEMTVAEYVLAVEGLAMARHILTGPDVMAERAREVASIVAAKDTELLGGRIASISYDVEDGYSLWAPRYDTMDNPVLGAEAPIVEQLIGSMPAGVALDAACGTGRHAASLQSLGWKVIGVDTTTAMLDLARKKVPSADFRQGRLEALPVDQDSVELVVCALALTHVEDLGPVFAEFARVLRPGGRLVTTDLHPFVAETGLMAGFPTDDPDPSGPVPTAIHFVPNLTHHAGEYVRAIVDAGLVIQGCREPRLPTDNLTMFPTWSTLPDATRQAYANLPLLLVWDAVKPG